MSPILDEEKSLRFFRENFATLLNPRNFYHCSNKIGKQFNKKQAKGGSYDGTYDTLGQIFLAADPGVLIGRLSLAQLMHFIASIRGRPSLSRVLIANFKPKKLESKFIRSASRSSYSSSTRTQFFLIFKRRRDEKLLHEFLLYFNVFRLYLRGKMLSHF